MDFNNQNNQFNQAQFGVNQINQFGQPNMNQNNQFNQYSEDSNYQYNPNQMYAGQPQMGYQNYQQPMVGGMNYNNGLAAPMTKKEFYKSYADKNTKSNIVTSAVFLYVCVAINFFAHVIAYENTSALIDCTILLASGLCIQLLYSRIAAVIALVYSIINIILMISMFGRPGGWLIIIAGVCACIGTFKLESEYKQHTGIR